MFLSPYSLTPTHLHGAEVGRGTGRGRGWVGSKAQYIALQTYSGIIKYTQPAQKHTSEIVL